MTYKALVEFLQHRMRMSHIYQPVMLMTLLKKQGRCHESEIAKSIMQYDDSQIEYYTHITNNMVGKVLRNHKIVEKEQKDYSLVGFEDLSSEQIQQLVELCQTKLDDYISKRGDRIWQHRRHAEGYISGTIKYEVLKRAKFRCELCGISADKKALEVDHILPRNKGGTDDISNFQALCYSCNAMKRDRDDTDFRGLRESYAQREKGCLFCETRNRRVVIENELAYATRDAFPVTEMHTLIIPKRHVATYFELGQAEVNACTQLLGTAKSEIATHDGSVQGFNIGVNDGASAGQTVMHCHIHLIPRRQGDAANPRGGVRHVIPGKGDY